MSLVQTPSCGCTFFDGKTATNNVNDDCWCIYVDQLWSSGHLTAHGAAGCCTVVLILCVCLTGESLRPMFNEPECELGHMLIPFNENPKGGSVSYMRSPSEKTEQKLHCPQRRYGTIPCTIAATGTLVWLGREEEELKASISTIFHHSN